MKTLVLVNPLLVQLIYIIIVPTTTSATVELVVSMIVTKMLIVEIILPPTKTPNSSSCCSQKNQNHTKLPLCDTICDPNQLGHGNIIGQDILRKKIKEFVSPGAEI